jgi:hypothetical protein
MENISVEDINFRLNKLKENVSKINVKIEENDKKNQNRFSFAKDLGIRVDILSNEINEVKDELDKYSQTLDSIMQKYDSVEEGSIEENEYKLLSNMLYSDDAKLKNIGEMLEDNIDLTTREYINLFANKANELIRKEELKDIDMNVIKLSKISLLEKLTGKAKIKRALIENYNLKRVETINKKYVPSNRSLYEIISITNNCGYKSKDLDFFVNRVVEEFKLDNPQNNAIAVIQDKKKIPFFFSKELLNRLNAENTNLADNINRNKKQQEKLSEYSVYREMLKNGVETLELFKFEEVV